jgi:hypothetical protein
MKPLTDRDKRTLRIGGIVLVAYLVLFGGLKLWRGLEDARAGYQQLVADAGLLRQQIETYESKAELLAKLRGDSGVELASLPKAALVARTSDAIQKAALGGGVKLGPIREAPGNAANGEIASMRLEAVGQVAAILGLIHQMQNLGWPLLIDSVQLSSEARQPGLLKLNVDLVILDFEKWKQQRKAPDA